MTTEEKRAKLFAYCESREVCEGCPMHDSPFFCGTMQRTLEKYLYRNVDITAVYNILFPNTAAPTIKDSGDRRMFDTGAVRDMAEGKGRMDLLPWAAIMEISKHCENGAKKYGEHNVDKGIPTHSLCDSAARHLAKYLDGWTDEPHLLAAAWNLLWAIQMEVKHPELVDTPWKDGV